MVTSNEDEGIVSSKEIISGDVAVVEIFNDCFVNIVPNSKISRKTELDANFSSTGYPVLNTISKYKNYPSFIIINLQVVPPKTLNTKF